MCRCSYCSETETKANFYSIQYTCLPPANEVWGKVMFLHLCVILFTGGRGVCPTPSGCRPPRVGQTPWMQTSRVGQTPPPGCRHPGLGRPPWMQTPPYSQQAGGTHPTGMHTYFGICISLGQCEWTISGTQCKPNIGILVGVKFYVTAIRPSHVLILRKPPHITWSSKLIF